MVDWKKLQKQIPDKVQITSSVYYEVLWSDNVDGKDHYGLTDLNNKQIIIKKGMKPKITVITFLHECTHAASYEYDLNLTETQVLNIEKFIYYILKQNNIFRKKRNEKI